MDSKNRKKWHEPARVFAEYKRGADYKASLGARGLYEQGRINERFYTGDQWHGVQCGDQKALIRYNVVKRIGDYKLAMVTGRPVSVAYFAEGVPYTATMRERVRVHKESLRDGSTFACGEVGRAVSCGFEQPAFRCRETETARGRCAPSEDKWDGSTFALRSRGTVPYGEDRTVRADVGIRPYGEADGAHLSPDEEIDLMMDVLSDYHKVTAERVKLNDLAALAMRKAYTTGTGVIYTYWDGDVRTGQYADEGRQSPILGDIGCEVLDIENVYFGDTGTDDVQRQPYILIAQRRSVEELRREARRNRRPAEEVAAIKPDRQTDWMAGDRAKDEPSEEQKATVLTKLCKVYKDDGSYSIHAVRVVEGAIVRAEWDTGLRMYPLAKMSWEMLPNSVYGDSEVTHLIPNQLAINKAITAAANAVTMNGMPILLVNGDVVEGNVTNEPGQVFRVFGANDLATAVKYVTPPVFAPQLDNLVNSMIANTLVQSGANEAALGDMKPENTSAIMVMQEAATRPLQLLQNRYYSFIEDIARIWAEFWVTMYGKRRLKIRDKEGDWYIPFDAEQARPLIINARVDVGPASMWSEMSSRQTLDNLYAAKIIDAVQYLDRLPRGTIPEQGSLLREVKERQTGGGEETTPPLGEVALQESGGAGTPPAGLLERLPEEYRQRFAALPPELQQEALGRLAL